MNSLPLKHNVNFEFSLVNSNVSKNYLEAKEMSRIENYSIEYRLPLLNWV